MVSNKMAAAMYGLRSTRPLWAEVGRGLGLAPPSAPLALNRCFASSASCAPATRVMQQYKAWLDNLSPVQGAGLPSTERERENLRYGGRVPSGVGMVTQARLYAAGGKDEAKGGAGEGTASAAEAERPSRLGMIQKYGVTFMVTWGALYCAPLAGIYGALSTGLIGGADAIEVLKYLGIDRLGIDISLINPTFGNVALSYGINEVLEVVRLPVAVAVTPMVAKVLGRRREQAAGGASEDGKPLGKLALEAKANQKLEMVKQYGITFLAWWTLLWAISWGGLYVALDNGLIGGQDGMELLAQIPYVDNFVDLKQLDLGENSKEWGNLGVSFVMNELLEVGRFPVAVATTPAVAKALGLRKKQ